MSCLDLCNFFFLSEINFFTFPGSIPVDTLKVTPNNLNEQIFKQGVEKKQINGCYFWIWLFLNFAHVVVCFFLRAQLYFSQCTASFGLGDTVLEFYGSSH